ncbi:hypothetical protein K502DRAFT_350471 [Neoconidiobolus thromboides FSU 785]|nr:hypothetical protein K502DRAFT_350471 [Neoconidiobolus thromboides FSU 785]
MNNPPSKLNANANKAMGIVKESVGWALSDHELKNEGGELRTLADKEYKQAQLHALNNENNRQTNYNSVEDNEEVQYENQLQYSLLFELLDINFFWDFEILINGHKLL